MLRFISDIYLKTSKEAQFAYMIMSNLRNQKTVIVFLLVLGNDPTHPNKMNLDQEEVVSLFLLADPISVQRVTDKRDSTG